MIELRMLFQRAIAGEEVTVPCDNAREANNLRQRLYRYREKVRQDPDDDLTLLVDYLIFNKVLNEIQIVYSDLHVKLTETKDVRKETQAESS